MGSRTRTAGRCAVGSGDGGPRCDTVKEVFVFVSCTDLPFTFSTPGAGEVSTSFSHGGGSHPIKHGPSPLAVEWLTIGDLIFA